MKSCLLLVSLLERVVTEKLLGSPGGRGVWFYTFLLVIGTPQLKRLLDRIWGCLISMRVNFYVYLSVHFWGICFGTCKPCVSFRWSHLNTAHAHTHSCIYLNDYTFIWMHVVCLFQSVCISIKAGAARECMVWVWRTKIRMLMHMYRAGALRSYTAHHTFVCTYYNVQFQLQV